MEFYHWIVLVLLVLLVVWIFTKVAGSLIRTVITFVAIAMFASFVYGTMSPENKALVHETVDTVKTTIVNFFNGIDKVEDKVVPKNETAIDGYFG